jgi:ABC-type nitrate/sulfonate/bicarbonate transport system substrate-binding protein
MQRRQFIATLTTGLITPLIYQNTYASTSTVKVIVFPGAQNLSMWVALEKGFFQAKNLDVQLTYTMNSIELRDGLASHRFDIAHSAVDNSVAIVDYKEQESVILMGGDSSLNELFYQPELKTLQDIRGKILVVDAPNTAYALQVKKALSLAGIPDTEYKLNPVGRTALRLEEMLKNKENAAAPLNPPFSIQAKQAGLKSMGRLVDLVGPYQGQGMFAMRPWINQNSEIVERYIAAWIQAVRWSLNPANRKEAIEILQKNMKLDPAIVEQSYELLVTPGFGLDQDAKFSQKGFDNLLSIRTDFGKGRPLDEKKLVDLSYYNRAFNTLK